MRQLSGVLLGLAVTAASSLASAYAQTARVPIYLSITAYDTVGQQLVYEIREQLNSSNQLSSTLTDSDSAFQIKVVTLDPYRSTDGGSSNSTVYSLVLTMHDPNNRKLSVFVDEWVGTCNALQVQSCAASMVADVGNDVQTVLGAIKANLETPQQ